LRCGAGCTSVRERRGFDLQQEVIAE
jgi:hypothetical protein